MTLLEFIRELEEVYEAHGDIEVFVQVPECGEDSESTEGTPWKYVYDYKLIIYSGA